MKILELAIAIKGKLDGSLTSSMQKAMSESRALQEQLKSVNKVMKDAQKAAAAEQKATGSVSLAQQKEIASLQEKINKLTERRADILDKVAAKETAKSKLSSATGKVTKAVGVTMVAAAPLIEATKAAMDFESAMADVRKVVDFDTPQQFKEMNGDILALSQSLPMAAEDIAKIVAAGGQSGIAREDLMAFAESATKMGIAFDITADQAGDMMAKWRTAFKMNQSEVVGLADKINYLGNTTAASAPLISDVVTRIGPLGEIGGLASSEIAALGASMVGTGVQSEVAATGIKNMILGLTTGEGATKTQAEMFAKLGTSAEEMAVKMQTDGKGAIMDIMKALQALPKEEQAATLKGLFGQESIGAIAPLLTNLDALSDNFEKVADASQYAGSMEGEYQARSQTTANQLQLAKNSFSALGISIGGVFLPKLAAVLGKVAELASGFAKWAQENQGLVNTIITIGGAIGGLVIAMLGINAAKAAFDYFRSSFALQKLVTDQNSLAMKAYSAATKIAAGAQAFFNAVMAGNPLALAAIAIMALVAGLVYLYNTNETFRNAVINAWNEIKNAAMEIWTAIAPIIEVAWDGIKQVVSSGIEILKGLWADISPAVSSALEMIIPIAITVVGFVKNVFVLYFKYIATVVKTAITVICAVIRGIVTVVSAIWNILSAGASIAWSIITTVFNTAVSVISAIIATLAPIFSAVWSVIQTVAKVAFIAISIVAIPIIAIIGAAMTVLGAVISAIWEGVKAVATFVWFAIQSVVTIVMAALAPIVEAGAAVINAIWENILAVVTPIWETIQAVVTMVYEAIAERAIAFVIKMYYYWTQIRTTAENCWNAIVDTVSSIWDTVQSIVDQGVASVTQKWENLKSIFSSPIQAVVNFVKGGSSEAADASGVDVAANALGGVYNKPLLTWVAEAGDTEVIVPINNKPRSMALWQTAGRMLGALPATTPTIPAESVNVQTQLATTMPKLEEQAKLTSMTVDLPTTPKAEKPKGKSPLSRIFKALKFLTPISKLFKISSLQKPLAVIKPIINTVADLQKKSPSVPTPMMNMSAMLPTVMQSREVVNNTVAQPRPIALEPANTGNQTINVNFSPNINISGQADVNVVDMIKRALAEQKAQFERELPAMIARMRSNERRLSYG